VITRTRANWPLSHYYGRVLADGPVAFWPLDDLNPSVVSDISGHAQNGTITGGVTLGQIGILATETPCMKFDGSTGYVNIPHSSTLAVSGPWTLEAWVFATTEPTGCGIITQAYNNTDVIYEIGVGMSAASGNSEFGVGFYTTANLWATAYASTTFPTNTWVYAVGVWTGTELIAYLNAQQVATASPSFSPADGGLPFYVGRRHDTAGTVNFWPGLIQAAAIYPYALSASQVLAHYNAGCTGLVGV